MYLDSAGQTRWDVGMKPEKASPEQGGNGRAKAYSNYSKKGQARENFVWAWNIPENLLLT